MQFTLSEIWAHTGLFARFIIFTLGIMSIASLVVMAERMIVFRKTRKDSRTFATKMGAILAKGGGRAHVRVPQTAQGPADVRHEDGRDPRQGRSADGRQHQPGEGCGPPGPRH